MTGPTGEGVGKAVLAPCKPSHDVMIDNQPGVSKGGELSIAVLLYNTVHIKAFVSVAAWVSLFYDIITQKILKKKQNKQPCQGTN